MLSLKEILLEGTKEKAVEDFISKKIKGTKWANKVFVAGGYVRDELMGKDPKDIDLLVNAPNGGIEFANWITQQVGAHREGTNPVVYPKYGTAKFNLRGVTHNGQDLSDIDIEAVMPRKEQYKPGDRKPDVSAGDLKDDVERRDFTVNSLLKDLSTGEVLDLTGQGKEDIKRGVVRTPLNPDKIFTDDPLRMLRAIRFTVKYDWDLPMFMIRSLKKNAAQLENISQERIRDELNKMLTTGHPDKAIKLLKVTNLITYVIPELKPLIGLKQGVHHKQDAFGHTLQVLKNTKPVLLQRLMALFHDIGKAATQSSTPDGIHFYAHEKEGEKIADDIMRRLKYPNELIDAVKTGIVNHMKLKHGGDDSVQLSDKTLRKFRIALGQNLEDTLEVIHADNISCDRTSELPNQIINVRKRLQQLDQNKKTDKPQIPIDGNDLIQIFHLKPGKTIGKILASVVEKWYDDPEISREEALRIAKDIIENDNL
jgi:poly(A) polymerase